MMAGTTRPGVMIRDRLAASCRGPTPISASLDSGGGSAIGTATRSAGMPSTPTGARRQPWRWRPCCRVEGLPVTEGHSYPGWPRRFAPGSVSLSPPAPWTAHYAQSAIMRTDGSPPTSAAIGYRYGPSDRRRVKVEVKPTTRGRDHGVGMVEAKSRLEPAQRLVDEPVSIVFGAVGAQVKRKVRRAGQRQRVAFAQQPLQAVQGIRTEGAGFSGRAPGG